MAYTELAVQTPTSSGITPTYSAAPAAGSKFSNDGRATLIVKNGGGGSITVTVATPGTVDGLAIGDKVVTVGAGAEAWIGGLLPQAYNNPDGSTDAGKVYVDYSGVSSVTVALHHA